MVPWPGLGLLSAPTYHGPQDGGGLRWFPLPVPSGGRSAPGDHQGLMAGDLAS